MSTTRLRLQDLEVENALRALWRAGPDGLPARQLRRYPEFVTFGVVERFINLASPGIRARLTDEGCEMVATLVLQKEETQ